MKTDEKKAISKEVAIIEFTKFLKKHNAKDIRRGKIKLEDIPEDYIDVIEAIQDGLVVFDDKDHPTYTLRQPLETESKDKELGVYTVSFRSRIRPSEKANVMSGLDVQKDAGNFSLRYIAFITQLSVLELDRLDTDDYDTINQICSVF